MLQILRCVQKQGGPVQSGEAHLLHIMPPMGTKGQGDAVTFTNKDKRKTGTQYRYTQLMKKGKGVGICAWGDRGHFSNYSPSPLGGNENDSHHVITHQFHCSRIIKFSCWHWFFLLTAGVSHPLRSHDGCVGYCDNHMRRDYCVCIQRARVLVFGVPNRAVPKIESIHWEKQQSRCVRSGSHHAQMSVFLYFFLVRVLSFLY